MDTEDHTDNRISNTAATRIIWVVSAVIFLAVLGLNRVQVTPPAGLDPHLFARLNAVINSGVSLLLALGLLAIRLRRKALHRRIMLSAITLSALFLVSYILHHLFAGDTRFGGTGPIRTAYYLILASHILLAAGSLPFILMTAWRALSADFPAHRRLARLVWPVWFYVSLSGVVAYLLISPYY